MGLGNIFVYMAMTLFLIIYQLLISFLVKINFIKFIFMPDQMFAQIPFNFLQD